MSVSRNAATNRDFPAIPNMKQQSRSLPKSSTMTPSPPSGASSLETQRIAEKSDLPTADKSDSPSVSGRQDPYRHRHRAGRVLRRKQSEFADFITSLTPAPSPVRLTVTATEVTKRRFPVSSSPSRDSRQALDDKGLRDLLSTRHTPATPSPSTRAKGTGATSRDSSSRSRVQDLWAERRIVSMAGAVCAFVLMFTLVLWLSSAYTDRTSTICDTLECRYYTQYLDDIANTSVDPCHDFYTHVCSRWVSRDGRSVKRAVYEE